MKNLLSNILCFILCIGSVALAKTDLSPQERQEKIKLHEKMAERHTYAANCLKEGKSLERCYGEAMHGCPMMNAHCPFMTDNDHEKAKSKKAPGNKDQ